MKSDNKKPTKTISDLALAAYLNATGHKIIEIIPESGNRRGFVFLATPQLEKEILNYFNRASKADPLALFEAYRNLKALAVRN
jgi:hypothetical protein